MRTTGQRNDGGLHGRSDEGNMIHRLAGGHRRAGAKGIRGASGRRSPCAEQDSPLPGSGRRCSPGLRPPPPPPPRRLPRPSAAATSLRSTMGAAMPLQHRHSAARKALLHLIIDTPCRASCVIGNTARLATAPCPRRFTRDRVQPSQVPTAAVRRFRVLHHSVTQTQSGLGASCRASKARIPGVLRGLPFASRVCSGALVLVAVATPCGSNFQATGGISRSDPYLTVSSTLPLSWAARSN